MLQVQIALPSGRNEVVSLPESSKMKDVKILAQKSFGQGFLRLISDGHVLNPEESLQAALKGRDHISAVALQARIQSTGVGAFALLCIGGDRVVTWGRQKGGCDSSAVQDQLRGVQQVQVTQNAFAAILADGSVVTWGRAGSGGDSSSVQDQFATL